MQIHFERTGGFAGIRMTAMVDTKLLPPEEVHDLQALVDAARFFEIPATMTAHSISTDRFSYKITVEAEGRRHTIETNDAIAPEAVRPLLQRLLALARSARGK